MRIKYFLIFLLFSSFALCQQDSIQATKVKENLTVPKFNIYAGLAWSRGFGIGVRILPVSNWSFDVSYCENPRMAFLFFGFPDHEARYSFGVNFHLPHLPPWAVSFSMTGVSSPRTGIPNENLLNYIIVALDFGVLSWEKKGFTFYAKGGIGQPIRKQLFNISGPYELGNLFLNFDVGVGWNFW